MKIGDAVMAIVLGGVVLAGPALAEPPQPDAGHPLTVPLAGAPAASTPAVPAAPGPAAAQPAAGQGDEQARNARARARDEDRRAFGEARLAALRAGLQLTPGQQPLWAPVEGALRDLGEARRALHRGRREMTDGADAAARLKERSRRMIAMGQAMGRLADAAAPLTASLTPGQKGRLPVLLRGVGPRRVVADAFGSDVERGGMERGMGRSGMDRRGGRMGMDRVGGRGDQRFGEGPDERDGHPGWGWRHRFGRYGDRRYDPDADGRDEPMNRGGFRRHGDEEERG